MPTPPGPPLRKVTLNLYEADVVQLERYYGHGWTIHVRDHVHDLASLVKPFKPQRRTLGDLAHDQTNQARINSSRDSEDNH